ncbi:MAG TPA: DUF4157 domain-containing protein [Candidatus Angelobacter sp.]
MSAPPIVHQVLNSPGQPLDTSTRSFFEPRFGHDFSKVRVHTDDRAAESARAVNALAYTVGRDVVFAAGQYVPHTHAGSRLLAHELAHSLQNPEPAGLFPFLEIGPVDDPSERAADSMADAVMRGQRPTSAQTSGCVLRRQLATCTAGPTNPPNDTQRMVDCPGGAHYRVTMTSSAVTQASVTPEYSQGTLSLRIRICRGGTQVEIIPQAYEIPETARQMLNNMLNGLRALQGVRINTGAQIVVTQHRRFTFSLVPRVTFGESGVTGYGGSLRLETPSLGPLEFGFSRDETPGLPPTNVFELRGEWGGGGRPQPPVHCDEVVFHCDRITHVPAVPEVKEKTEDKPEFQYRYLFFDYKTDNIRRNFRPLPTDIQSLYDQGFRITSVEGFTSPEGPRPAGPNFKGNIVLGEKRADRALRWLREEACPNCDLSGVRRQGQGELPPKQGKKTPEPTGGEMETGAVAEFLGLAPDSAVDPLAPQDSAGVAAFQALPQAEQRERAFQLMRRAVITLTLSKKRVIQPYTPAVPARDETKPESCPPEVIDAAAQSFGTGRTGSSTR